MSARRCVVCSKRRPAAGARWRDCDDPGCVRRREGTCAGQCTDVHAGGHARAVSMPLFTPTEFRRLLAEALEKPETKTLETPATDGERRT